MNLTTAGVLISILRRNKRHDQAEEPSKYIALVDKKYTEYLTEVVLYLNHEHGVPLMANEVADSRLVDYIVNSFVTDIPVEKCASNIVSIVDELVVQAEADETEV